MKLRSCLIASGILLATIPVPAARANVISCSVELTADRTEVCIGETVNVTAVEINCSQSTISNYSKVYGTNGTYILTNTCSACDNSTSEGYLTIHVVAFTNLFPSAVTMCKDCSTTFTTLSNPGTATCEPAWGFSPTNAGTLAADGATATFALSGSYTGATATVYAYCGVTTNYATVTVATNETLTIVSNPVSRVTCPGSNVTYSVTAIGNSLHYQWRKDGVNLVLGFGERFSGVTNATLTIHNVFQPSTVSNVAYGNSKAGADLGPLEWYDTYTYRASGCIAFENNVCSNPPCATADPDGNVYFGGGCTNLVGAPSPASADFNFPGYVAWSLVGRYQNGFTPVQMGKSGMFQAMCPAQFKPTINDEVYGDNSGSWEVVLTHTLEGVYDVIVTSDCGSKISAGATLGVSTDCDGIPDGWRTNYFGSLVIDSNTCATCDYDHDGVNNLQEFQRRTDPTNRANVNIMVYADANLGNDQFDGYAATVGGGHGPKQDIQAAITAAISNDTVQVAAGTYTNTTFYLNGKNILVRPSGGVTVR